MTAAVLDKPATEGGKKAAPVMLRPFRIGVQNTDEHTYDETRTTNAGTQDLPTYSLNSSGFLTDIYVWVVGTTAGNGAAVTFASRGPFNGLASIEFDDVNNKPVVGPFDGWEMGQICKLGGYAFSDDPKSSPTYSAITGAGATGGSFEFIIRIPIQIVPRDALGSLPNKSNTSTFKIRTRLNNTASIYGVAPTAAPSVRVRMQPCSWWEPDESDLKGRRYQQQPPAVTTTQYWVRNDYILAPGAISPSLDAVGFPIRNLIFGLEDSVGSRTQGETDFPDPFQLQVEANVLIDRFKRIWQHRQAQAYGYTGATFDAAEAHDSGMYVEPFCQDFGPKPGWETRYGYLETASGTRLQVKGTLLGSGAHTLRVWTNYIAPANGDVFALTGR
jgi:hypothetical protein